MLDRVTEDARRYSEGIKARGRSVIFRGSPIVPERINGRIPCPTPGRKIRSQGAGRGLGQGRGRGPVGVPYRLKRF